MKSRDQKKSKSFSDEFAELERIVQRFEQEELNVDDGLQEFERGLHIAERIKKQLESVENKIVQLKKKYHAAQDANQDDE